MNKVSLLVATLLLAICAIPRAWAQDQTLPAKPQPTVPEMFTIEGQYVRVAYNNEGFATLGYRTAQNSIGNEWILLNTGITMMKDVKDYVLKRENLTLKTPS